MSCELPNTSNTALIVHLKFVLNGMEKGSDLAKKVGAVINRLNIVEHTPVPDWPEIFTEVMDLGYSLGQSKFAELCGAFILRELEELRIFLDGLLAVKHKRIKAHWFDRDDDGEEFINVEFFFFQRVIERVMELKGLINNFNVPAGHVCSRSFMNWLFQARVFHLVELYFSLNHKTAMFYMMEVAT